jgi:hypothetical protein
MSLPIKAIIARNHELHAELLKVASDPDQVDKLLAQISDKNIQAQLKALVVDRVNRLADDGPMSNPLDPYALTEVSVDAADHSSMPSLLDRDPLRPTKDSANDDHNPNSDTVINMEELDWRDK